METVACCSWSFLGLRIFNNFLYDHRAIRGPLQDPKSAPFMLAVQRSVRDMKSASIPERRPQLVLDGHLYGCWRNYLINTFQAHTFFNHYSSRFHIQLSEIVSCSLILRDAFGIESPRTWERRWLEYHANSGGRGGRGGGYVRQYNQSRKAEMDDGRFNPGLTVSKVIANSTIHCKYQLLCI